jgi:hypothetical protein
MFPAMHVAVSDQAISGENDDLVWFFGSKVKRKKASKNI